MNPKRVPWSAVEPDRPKLTAVILPGEDPVDLEGLLALAQPRDLNAEIRVVMFARASEAEFIESSDDRTVITVPDHLAGDHRTLRRMVIREPFGDVFRFLTASDVSVQPWSDGGGRMIDRLIEAGVPHPRG